MLELRDVTLICLTGVGHKVDEHVKALEYSQKGVAFGDVRYVQMGNIKNIDDWSKAIFYDLGSFVDTSHALLIHENGFVVHPECWKDEWLQYDFAGSPFPLPTDSFSYRDIHGTIQRVGNSVGLRSKKLLDLPKKLGLEWKSFHGFYNEDGAVSVNYRHIFEEHGCRYMPLEEAVYFGRENDVPENRHIDTTFVFHNYKGRNEKYKDL